MRIDPTTTSNVSSSHYALRAYGANALGPLAKIQPTGPAQSEIGADGQQQGLPDVAQRLVAGVVPGRVDFSADQPRQAGEALQMYRHPADRNAAAVSVSVGRRLDVQG